MGIKLETENQDKKEQTDNVDETSSDTSLEESTESNGSSESTQDSDDEKLFTQDELNSKIQERLGRLRDKHSQELESVKSEVESRYAGEIDELQKRISDFEAQVADLNAQVLHAKVAESSGIPLDVVKSFKATSEDELLAAVDALKKHYPSGGQRLRPQLSEGYVPDAMSDGKKASVLRGMLNNQSKRII